MTVRTYRTSSLLTAILAVGLAVSGPASAVYMITPLHLTGSSTKADVGDTVTFIVEPTNASEARAWAGRTIVVNYGYDSNERANGDENSDAPSNSSGWTRRVLLAELALDGDAKATFTWTVPEEVQDKNVVVTLDSEDGDTLATADVAVGDAPPIMRAMSGGPDDGRESLPPASEDDARKSGPAPDDARSVPFVGAAGVVGIAVGLVALAVGRRL